MPVRKLDKIITSLPDLRKKYSQADFNSKWIWSFLLVQALLWTIILYLNNIKKTEPDGTERFYTVEDLKKILVSSNEDSTEPADDDSRLRGQNTEIFNDSGSEIITDLFFKAVINKMTWLLHIDAQKKPHPGYILIDRELYYAEALEVSSKGIEFRGTDYSKMPNSISVWFLLDAPVSLRNQAVREQLIVDKELSEKDTAIKKATGILNPTVTQILYTVGVGNYDSSCSDLVRLADLMCGACKDDQERLTEFKALLKKYGWKETAESTAEAEGIMEVVNDYAWNFMRMQKEKDQAEINAVKARAAKEEEAVKAAAAKKVAAADARAEKAEALAKKEAAEAKAADVRAKKAEEGEEEKAEEVEALKKYIEQNGLKIPEDLLSGGKKQ